MHVEYWLISYQRQAVYLYADGLRRNAPVDVLSVVAIHPASFVLHSKRAVSALAETTFNPKRAPMTADDVLRIYSATQIPNGVAVLEGLHDAHALDVLGIHTLFVRRTKE